MQAPAVPPLPGDERPRRPFPAPAVGGRGCLVGGGGGGGGVWLLLGVAVDVEVNLLFFGVGEVVVW